MEVKPGNTTTEWTGTKIVHLLAVIVAALGAVPQIPWVQVTTSVLAVVASLLKQADYERNRVAIKTAPETLPPFLQGDPPK